MQTDAEVAAIAAGLTKAQRDAVLGTRRLDSGTGMWSLRNSLAGLGLVEGFAATPTPLWSRVAQHLKQENAK